MIQEESCGFYLKQLNDALGKNANNALRSQDLTFSQMGVLIYLSERSGRQATFKEIEKAIHNAQSTTAGVMTRLEKKGFVECFGSVEDKRIKVARLTDKGDGILSQSGLHMEETEGKLTNGFTKAEKEMFLELLKKASANMI